MIQIGIEEDYLDDCCSVDSNHNPSHLQQHSLGIDSDNYEVLSDVGNVLHDWPRKEQESQIIYNYYVGISKSKLHDCYFHEISSNLREKYHLFDCMFQRTVNGVTYSGNNLDVIPSEVASIINEDEWNQYIVNPLNKLISSSQHKKYELHELLMNNPNLSYTTFVSVHCNLHAMYEALGVMTAWKTILLSPIVGLLVLSQFALFIMAEIMNIFACIHCRRGNENEIEFIRDIINNFPGYDTAVIDQEIESSINTIITTLNERYPALYFAFLKSDYKVHRYSGDYSINEEFDAYLIHISPNHNDQV